MRIHVRFPSSEVGSQTQEPALSNEDESGQKEPITIRISSQKRAALKERARRQHRKVSEVINMAPSWFLQQNQ